MSEVKHAIRATGPDDISADFFKIMNDDSIKTLTALFNKIYDTDIISEKWLSFTFVTLPKKCIARSCEDFHTISLMCHMLKISLKIFVLVFTRNVKRTAGIHCITGEALFSIQVLIQRCTDVNFICFVYTQKLLTDVNIEKCYRC